MAGSAAEVAAAGRTAGQALLARLDDEQLVMRLVDSYVADFGRDAIKAPPQAFRQRLAALSREVLLFTAAELTAAAAGCFVWLRLGSLRWPDKRRRAQFEESFYATLAGEFELGAEPRAAFEAAAAAYRSLRTAATRMEHFAQRVGPGLEPVPELEVNARHTAESFAPLLTKLAQDVCRQALAGGN